jgi:5-methylcytosine-specific restriction endonuclease McrA
MPAYQEEKLCPDCGRILPRSAFYSKGKSKMDGKAYLTTRCKECHRRWRSSPKQRQYETEQMRKWREENREEWNAYMREWRSEHPDCDDYRSIVYREYNSRRGRGRIKRKEWRAIIRLFGGCAYCGATEDLQVDHFIPISLGGTNDLSNFVPACVSCNASKNNTHPRDFLSPADYDRIVKVLSSYG